MINFFRHIRKSLVENRSGNAEGHKVRKYFLYAIGEISLVVIGILIALQVNNWNQQRLDRANEAFYLQNLRNDLVLQVDEFEMTGSAEDTVARNLRDVGEMLNRGLNPEDMEELNLKLSSLLANRSVNIFDATFDDLKSTGNLKLISDENLRQELTEFYQLLERADRVVIKNEGFKSQIREEMIRYSLVNFNVDYAKGLTNFLESSNIPIRNPVQDSGDKFNFNQTVMKKLQDDEEVLRLSNMLTSRYLSSLVTMAILNNAKNSAEELISSIDNYTEK